MCCRSSYGQTHKTHTNTVTYSLCALQIDYVYHALAGHIVQPGIGTGSGRSYSILQWGRHQYTDDRTENPTISSIQIGQHEAKISAAAGDATALTTGARAAQCLSFSQIGAKLTELCPVEYSKQKYLYPCLICALSDLLSPSLLAGVQLSANGQQYY